jgi:hypothetical protein
MVPFRSRATPTRGQTLVEFALAVPLFVMVLTGIITLGIGVFYQQQITNAAREAARYAGIHSASAQCPTVSSLDPSPATVQPGSYYRCDTAPWPLMTAAGRNAVFGIDRSAVQITACWEGYQQGGQWDAWPPGTYAGGITSTATFDPCSIDGVTDPASNPDQIGCSASLATTDTSSDLSSRDGSYPANRVTVYACYVWQPPLAGFFLIPSTVTLRAVISEPMQRQQ